MDKQYTIEQIRTYLQSQDSFSDVFYNLKNIDSILEDIRIADELAKESAEDYDNDEYDDDSAYARNNPFNK